MRIALTTSIEPNRLDINTLKQGYIREYETEALECFKNWRENGGWLKDIPIHCLCPTKKDISEETKNRLKELNVTYTHKYYPETDNYQNGYWNIPLAGKYFEETLEEDILIKIDLDMYLIKPFSKEMLAVELGVATVGRYDESSAKHNTNELTFPEKYGQPWDTGLVIAHRDTFFFTKFYNKLKQITSEYEGGIFEELYGLHIKEHPEDYGVDYGAIEEFAVSILNTDECLPLKEQIKYNLGEFYAPISIYSDKEVAEIYFFHEHIPFTEPTYDKFRTRIEYYKRANNSN